MKLKEFICETEFQDEEKQLYTVVKKCLPFLNQVTDYSKPLFRGIGGRRLPPISINGTFINRQPIHTGLEIHIAADQWFLNNMQHRYRSNSVFATSNENTASEFGRTYRFLPIGNFTFCWSPIVADMTVDLLPKPIFGRFKSFDTLSKKIEERLTLANYQTTNLEAAILSENEIMFNCAQYYLLSNEMSEILDEMVKK